MGRSEYERGKERMETEQNQNRNVWGKINVMGKEQERK